MPPREIPLTPRGAATRDRIVHATADLMYMKGVHTPPPWTTSGRPQAPASPSCTGTSPTRARWCTRSSRCAGRLRGQQVIERETQRLGRLNSYNGLIR